MGHTCAAETRIVVNEGGEDEAYPFMGITKSIGKDWTAWLEWSTNDDVYHAPLPSPYNETRSSFHRLLFYKVFREDALQRGVQLYVGEQMGNQFAESPQTSMDEVFHDLDKHTPCILILSKGADPTNMVLRYAGDRGYADRIHLVSLGQGQGPVAEQLIDKACQRGDYVLLQNAHLGKSWMPELEKIIMDFPNRKIHDDFRLFLTSAPATYFPVAVLQNGVKMTNEPPNGIRANVTKSFQSLVKEEFFESSRRHAEFKKLLCSIAFFTRISRSAESSVPLVGTFHTHLTNLTLRHLSPCSIASWKSRTKFLGALYFSSRDKSITVAV